MAMSKKDLLPMAILLAALFAWPVADRYILKKFYPERAAEPVILADTNAAPVRAELKAAPAEPAAVDAAAPEAIPAPAPVVAADEAELEAAGQQPEARQVTLSNDRMDVVLSTRGGTVAEATLKTYRSTLAKDSPPVRLDFSDRPALAYVGLGGLGDAFDFREAPGADGRSVTFDRRAANGLRLQRTVQLGDGYVLKITDVLRNEGAEALALRPVQIRTGPMRRETGHKDAAGIVYLGVDTLSPGGEKVLHLGKTMHKLFDREMEEAGLPAMPVVIDAEPHENPVDWVAAKNKYFVQILTPEGGGEGSRVYARRELSRRELENPAVAERKMTSVTEVGASVVLAEQTLQPGEAASRTYTYYVGPKKYTELHAAALHQVDVMELGDWIKPISKLLLRVLNFIHDHLPPHNYGIAIILLTIIVRVVFWPITHKSTESMKRMAAVAPLVNELRAKYKDNPQKQQQEIMALYKEHKVNPLGGCLPMLIQIPVFFALFMVLRSAIELRFASFLWIGDLSEPENLFPGAIPFVGSLNLLPILMAGTMWLQMKLSPSAGDPAQQKIMAVMMPIMMLVFLYNFASGLALYWTTQNVLMIVQQMMMKRKAAHAPAKA
jgi:YidC/Oxa1 family membrane protein insertase